MFMLCNFGTAQNNLGKPPASGRIGHQHQPGHQEKTAENRHQHGLQRGVPGIGAFVVEPDEQIGGKTGQLPENEHQQNMIGEHHAQHGGHKRDDIHHETALLRMPFKVALRIENNQCADAADDQCEQ